MELLIPGITVAGLFLIGNSVSHASPVTPAQSEGYRSEAAAALASGTSIPSTLSPPAPRETYDPFNNPPSEEACALRSIHDDCGVNMRRYTGPKPSRPWTESRHGHPHFVPDRSIGRLEGRRGDAFYDESNTALEYRIGSDELTMRKQPQAPLFAPTLDRRVHGTPVQTAELREQMRVHTASIRDNGARPMAPQQQQRGYFDAIGEMMAHGRGMDRSDYTIRAETKHAIDAGLQNGPAFAPHADANLLQLHGAIQRKRKAADAQLDPRAFGMAGFTTGGERLDPEQLPLRRHPERLDQSYTGIGDCAVTTHGAHPLEGPLLPDIKREDARDDAVAFGYVDGGTLGALSTARETDRWNNRSDLLARQDQTLWGNVRDIMHTAFFGPQSQLYKEISRKNPYNGRTLGNVSHGTDVGARLTAPMRADETTMKEMSMYQSDGYINRMPQQMSASGYLLNSQVVHDAVPRNEYGEDPRAWGQAGSHINHAAIAPTVTMSARTDGQRAAEPIGGMSLSAQAASTQTVRREDMRVNAPPTNASSATGLQRANNELFGQSTRGLSRDTRNARSPFDLQDTMAAMRDQNPLLISGAAQQKATLLGFI